MMTAERTAQELMDLEARYGAHNYHPLDVVLARGEGCWVWDVTGRRYLDCLAGYSALNQGHCHPRLVRALTDQAQRLALTSRAFRNEHLGPFCQALAELTGFQRVLPMNTGAEAVETALKAARKWGYTVKGVAEGQAEILVPEHNFAGRTITIVSFSDEEQYRFGFGPFTPGFKLVPYGDAVALEAAITPNTVAVFTEPIQGEGGIIMPPPGWLRDVRDICTRHRVLLIVDEIQSGLGRTGRMFAGDHEGVRPDGMTLGKALSGGMYPVSAFVADDELMGVFQPGDHGSTYGGNPLGAAVAREALAVLVDEELPANADRMGSRFRAGLARLPQDHIREIRQIGLWIGIELLPEAGGARRYCEALMAEGMLCKETHTHVIRVAPPLTITAEEVDGALERLGRVFEALG